MLLYTRKVQEQNMELEGPEKGECYIFQKKWFKKILQLESYVVAVEATEWNKVSQICFHQNCKQRSCLTLHLHSVTGIFSKSVNIYV